MRGDVTPPRTHPPLLDYAKHKQRSNKGDCAGGVIPHAGNTSPTPPPPTSFHPPHPLHAPSLARHSTTGLSNSSHPTMASGPANAPPDLEWKRGAVEAFRIVSRTLAPQQEWLQSQGVDTDRPATEQTGRLDDILVQAQIKVVKAMRSEGKRTNLSAELGPHGGGEQGTEVELPASALPPCRLCRPPVTGGRRFKGLCIRAICLCNNSNDLLLELVRTVYDMLDRGHLEKSLTTAFHVFLQERMTTAPFDRDMLLRSFKHIVGAYKRQEKCEDVVTDAWFVGPAEPCGDTQSACPPVITLPLPPTITSAIKRSAADLDDLTPPPSTKRRRHVRFTLADTGEIVTPGPVVPLSPNLLLSSLLLLPRPYHPSPHTLPPSSPLLLGQPWLTRCLPQLSLPPPLHSHHVQHLSQQSQRACSPPPHPLLHSHHVPSHHLLPPHLPPPPLSTKS